MDGVQKVRKSGHFSGKSDFFEFSRGGTRVWTTFFDLVLGFPLGFSRFFRKFWVFRGFPGFSGVPVIKEGKAIALRTIDIFDFGLVMRNAMVPGFIPMYGKFEGILPKTRWFGGSKTDEMWAVMTQDPGL